MSWMLKGDAVTVGGTAVGDTSTSTIELDDTHVVGKAVFRTSYLRMFGLWSDPLSTGVAMASVPSGYEAPPTVSLTPLLDRDASDPVIRFVDSNLAFAGAPARHSFAIPSSSSANVFQATGIPASRKGVTLTQYAPRTLPKPTAPGTATAKTIQYHDPFVLDLPAFGELEAGRLMVLCRIRTLDGPPLTDTNGDEMKPLLDVVCFWAPEDDPGFNGLQVKGPFWLASCADAVSPDDRFADYRFFLGVPSACLSSNLHKYSSLRANAVRPVLHVYYTAEVTAYDMTIGGTAATQRDVTDAVTALGFIPGTYRRDVDLIALTAEIATTKTSPADGTAWNDEDPSYDLVTRARDLVTGTNAGRVVVSSFRDWFTAYSDTTGDTPISPLRILTDIQQGVFASLAGAQIKVIDAQVVRDPESGELTMFFRLGVTGSGTTPAAVPNAVAAWAALWRATSTGEPGNFVVEYDRDRAVWDKDAADPDPVRRPDGTWDVFYGMPGVSPPKGTQRASGS